MFSILIEVNVEVESLADAHEIADDLHEILNDSRVTNSINITDEISS